EREELRLREQGLGDAREGAQALDVAPLVGPVRLEPAHAEVRQHGRHGWRLTASRERAAVALLRIDALRAARVVDAAELLDVEPRSADREHVALAQLLLLHLDAVDLDAVRRAE